jgi:hypothetical protein
MSEQAEEQETEKAPSQPSSWSSLKRLAITVIFLVLFIPVFGKILPAILFGPPKEKTIEKPARQEIPPLREPGLTTVPPANAPIAAPVPAPDTQAAGSEPEPYTESAAPPVTPPTSQAEDERIRALEEKIARLEAAQGSAVSNLENKIDSQNSELRNKTSALLSALIIFGQVKDALKNGDPYDTQLEQLKKFTENEPQAQDIIASLAENAARGLATPARLKEKFNPLAKQVIASLSKSAWLSTLHKFITIRKIGEQEGDDDEAILARAEVKLTQGDVNGALKEIEQLTPESQEIFAPWAQDAQNWLDANDNLSKLQLLLTQTSIAAEP